MSIARTPRRSLRFVGSLLVLLAISACKSGGGGTDPAPDGTVTVTISTTGADLPSGYSFTVTSTDGSVQVSGTIPANGSRNFTGVSPGVSVQVQNSDIPENCTLAGQNPRSVSAVDGACSVSGENPRTLAVAFNQTAETTFQITCPVRLTVHTETTGSDLDGDGYSLAVDGGAPGDIGVNASQDFGLSAGDHTLELTGVAANCTVTGDNPRTVTPAASTAGESTFQETCQAIPGDIEVAVTTTGWDIPTEFGVSVDSESQGNIGSNATLQLPGWLAQNHTVALTGVPANCSVQGGNPVTVDVVADGTTAAPFVVACAGVAFGSGRDGGGSRRIFVGDSDGLTPPTRVTPGLWYYQDPTWSPDRTRIAYSRAIAEGNPNLAICVIPAKLVPGRVKDRLLQSPRK